MQIENYQLKYFGTYTQTVIYWYFFIFSREKLDLQYS